MGTLASPQSEQERPGSSCWDSVRRQGLLRGRGRGEMGQSLAILKAEPLGFLETGCGDIEDDAKTSA